MTGLRILGRGKRLVRKAVRYRPPLLRPESVFFYTFHKTGSTLFTRYVLKRLGDRHHLDYAADLYDGRIGEDVELTFHRRGMAYGPIRLSEHHNDPTYRRLVAVTARPDFVADRSAIFFVRDPRDILLSAYYSFGYTHPVRSATPTP